MEISSAKGSTRTPHNQKSNEKQHKQPPEAVIVVGMHRAGTSAVTRGLNLMGVYLGDDLLGPHETNPTGFWEDRAIVDINDKVLATLGKEWHSLEPTKLSQLENIDFSDLRIEAADLIRERFRGHPLWGFKDPRVCRLLSFWQPVFQELGVEESYVIVIRNPLSVARSLKVRDRFSTEKSYLLWLQHFIPAVAQTHGKQRVIVDFDEFMANPIPQLERIADRLNIPIDASAHQSLIRFSTDFLNDSLRHARFSIADLRADERAPHLLVQVCDYMHQLANDQVSGDRSDISRQWDVFEGRLDSFSSLLPYIEKLEVVPGRPELLMAQLFIDCGFEDEDMEAEPTEPMEIRIYQDTSELKFDLNGLSPKRLRFDPANTFLIMNLEKITFRGSDSSVHEVTEYITNAERDGSRLVFDSDDPKIFMDIPSGLDVTECRIKLKYVNFGYEAMPNIIRMKLNIIRMQVNTLNQTGHEISLRTEQAGLVARSLNSTAPGAVFQHVMRKHFFRPWRASAFRKAAELIIESKLFDYSFYLTEYPEVADSGIHPLVHFLQFGAAEGRDPNALFCVSYYKEMKPEVNFSNPLVHFISHGWLEGRNPHPLFDISFYLEKNPDVAQAGVNPLTHFLLQGRVESRSPHPLFDTSSYIKNNPDLALLGINPLVHFLKRGASEGRNPHPLFDTSFYLANNPEVAGSGLNPLVHFLLHGGYEGRDPNPLFDTSIYLKNHPDVAQSGINPLVHFVLRAASVRDQPCNCRGGVFSRPDCPTPGSTGRG